MSLPKQPSRDEPTESAIRLQKVLAAAGIGSRRHCEEYILAGRVTVDGEEVTDLGRRVDPESQKIHLDGELIRSQPKRYYLLNKPPGYMCTNRDPAGRPRAIDLIKTDETRLFTVGRLDENSRGLILVTNDGELANRLAHPRYGIRRHYRVQVAGSPTRETISKLKEGIHFTDGKFRVQGIRRVGSRGKSTFLEITLTEGQNREIRRLLARVGHKVMDLQRVGFGPLRLARLAEGRHRPLRTNELKELRDLIAEGPQTGRTKSRAKKGAKRKASRPPKRNPRKRAGKSSKSSSSRAG